MKKLSALFMIPALAVSLAACGGDEKPTKEEVTSGLSTAMGEYIDEDVADQLGQEALDNYYSCIVDESYDDLSNDTLQSLADGEEPTASSDSDDYATFEAATETCVESLTEDAMSNLEG